MHHFVYPAKDTYITNRVGLDAKNFGVTEILKIGTKNIGTRILNSEKTYSLVNYLFTNYSTTNFTGIFTGSLNGTVIFATGSISGSGLSFSSSYFSGSVNGTSSVGSGSFGDPISGSDILGNISGSLSSTVVVSVFEGQLTGSSACLLGTGSGIDVRNEENWQDADTKFISRALLQFNLTAISQSIADGSISSPRFLLKIKVADEYQLPVNYTIYALPISQSWNMGNGYWSDGGSDLGASWVFKDNNQGTMWYVPSISASAARPAINFINNPGLVTQSFEYGGGTFYTSSWCSQSFNYESSDISMDITPMVMSWISGSIPNEGLMLISSDELVSTGSGFVLTFFSRDTNTIYYPYIDVGWDDVSSIYATGSIFTSSINISTASAGISASIASGSTFSIIGGVKGNFSGSSFLTIVSHYITASNALFNYKEVKAFTGSFDGFFIGYILNSSGSITGSGMFSASYFSGSVDGVPQELSGSVSGSFDGLVTGSIDTHGYPIGEFNGVLTSSLVSLYGTGSGYYFDPLFVGFSGIVDAIGYSGNINGIPVVGNSLGLMTVAYSNVIIPNTETYRFVTTPNEAPYTVGYFVDNVRSPYNSLIDLYFVLAGDPDGVGWTMAIQVASSSVYTGSCGDSFSAQLVSGSLISGIFSGSTFVAYYSDYELKMASLSGSWNPEALYGASVVINLPSPIDPYVYAYVKGIYVSGTALGSYTVFNATSASFNGQFINGELKGGVLNLQLTGSVYTASFLQTSSVQISSSVLVPLETSRSFTLTLQNVQPEYKAGDIIKFNVFGRKQYPLKYFGKSTQQEQFIIPEYLPSSSYYALKDNQTGEIIMNFDSYTRIGCEYPTGNYFLIDTTSLPQERYYTVLIRVEDGQSAYTIDTGKTFKVTR